MRFMGGDRFRVASAGTQPGARVNPEALATLERHHIPASNLAPNDLSKYRGQSFDYVISLCEIVVQCASFEKLRRLDR
jgi:protein-tyrosine-phosphatase